MRHSTSEEHPIAKRRSFLRNGCLVVIGFFIALAIGEVLLRITHLGTSHGWVSYGDLPFKYRPFHKFMNKKEHLNLVILNNWGFHDHYREATSQGYRFLALGDSYVEGNQVTVENLFTSLIEQTFRQMGQEIEVINAGVGGVGTAYEYLLWKEFFQKEITVDHILALYN